MPEKLPELTLEAKKTGFIQFMEVARKASLNTQKVSARHPSSLQPKTCSFSWTT